ncbi:MAG: VanZ family protein [Thermosynechococcaceae cyanobacterium]
MNELSWPQRSLILMAWLGFMGLMFYFSTRSWGGTETRSDLDVLLSYVPLLREHLSAVDLDRLNYILRKMAHFTEYALLTTLGYFAWSRSLGQSTLPAIRYTLGCSIAFAITDEFHQLFEPGRTSLLTDVLIDSLGASVVALVLFSLNWRSQPS